MTGCAGGSTCLAFVVISPQNPAATPPLWAPSAANAAPTANAKPPNTRVSCCDEPDTTLVVARWEFAGLGYLTSGDTALALSSAARARERRQAARDAA